MTEKDELIKLLKQEELVNNDFSYFGWEGIGNGAFLTIATAYKEAAELIYEKMKNGHIGDKDILVYPLCFNYRHCMELLLKFLYIGHSKIDKEGLKDFLNTNHDLNKIWQQVKPILSAGKKRVGTKVNIGKIEHYVKEMHKFDEKSMRMRYPISKSVEKNNDNLRLDFHNFHNCMTKFYDAIIQIDDDISGQVHYQASQNDFDMFMGKYKKSKQSLIDFINYLKPYVRDKEIEFNINDIRDFSNEKIDDLIEKKSLQTKYLDELTCDDKVLIETLYYAGRDVKTQRVKLSLSPKEEIEDFVSFCLLVMKPEYGVEFGVEPTHLNAMTKDEGHMIECIQISMNILDRNR